MDLVLCILIAEEGITHKGRMGRHFRLGAASSDRKMIRAGISKQDVRHSQNLGTKHQLIS